MTPILSATSTLPGTGALPATTAVTSAPTTPAAVPPPVQRTAAEHDRCEALYRRNHASVRGWLISATYDVPLAEDLAAEVFLRAWRHLDRLYSTDEHDPAGVKNWLFRIARTTLIDHRKSAYARRVETVDALPEPGQVPSAEDTVVVADESQRLAQAVRDAIAALPPAQRTVLHGALAGQSAAQIAAATGRTTGAVKMLLHRGRVQLRLRLGVLAASVRGTGAAGDVLAEVA